MIFCYATFGWNGFYPFKFGLWCRSLKLYAPRKGFYRVKSPMFIWAHVWAHICTRAPLVSQDRRDLFVTLELSIFNPIFVMSCYCWPPRWCRTCGRYTWSSAGRCRSSGPACPPGPAQRTQSPVRSTHQSVRGRIHSFEVSDLMTFSFLYMTSSCTLFQL
jgi:hypothetical protein